MVLYRGMCLLMSARREVVVVNWVGSLVEMKRPNKDIPLRVVKVEGLLILRNGTPPRLISPLGLSYHDS